MKKGSLVPDNTGGGRALFAVYYDYISSIVKNLINVCIVENAWH
jgi:hypothetical protein